jgi:CheY-like chemotaxis protein
MPHKLLLADDSVTIQRVIELTFADEDVQVIAVGDGAQAIAHVQRDRPDIVLADVGMPERDGYEVAAFIKGNAGLSHIPVLLLTGAFEPVDETRARAAGCDGVLVKPFEPQMVISRVKDLLAGRRAAPSTAAAAPLPVPTASAPAEFDLKGSVPPPAPAVPPAPAGSLEDYFDRLDAAFATLETGPSPAPPAAAPASFDEASPSAVPVDARLPAPALADDGLAGWDPDLAGDPARPAAFEPPPSDAPPAPPQPPLGVPVPGMASGAPIAAPAPTSAAPFEVPPPNVPMPSLADAFSALLAAEQGQTFAPSTVAPVTHIPEAVIDDIVRRVVARMGDQAMRDVVLEAAERLVREEIARIKARQAQ